jgi:hypothetical protein
MDIREAVCLIRITTIFAAQTIFLTPINPILATIAPIGAPIIV